VPSRAVVLVVVEVRTRAERESSRRASDRRRGFKEVSRSATAQL
jgi:hypothetical protein